MESEAQDGSGVDVPVLIDSAGTSAPVSRKRSHESLDQGDDGPQDAASRTTPPAPKRAKTEEPKADALRGPSPDEGEIRESGESEKAPATTPEILPGADEGGMAPKDPGAGRPYAYLPAAPSVYTTPSGVQLKLPAFHQNIPIGKCKNKRRNWFTLFITANREHIHEIGVHLAWEAWEQFIDQDKSIPLDTLKGLKSMRPETKTDLINGFLPRVIQREVKLRATEIYEAKKLAIKTKRDRSAPKQTVASAPSDALSNVNMGAATTTTSTNSASTNIAAIESEIHSGVGLGLHSDNSVRVDAEGRNDAAQLSEMPTASEWASLLGPAAEEPSFKHLTQPMEFARDGKKEASLVTADEELSQQRKYFPGAANPSQMCLLCARSGHRAAECSTLKCKFCQSSDHTRFQCPQRVRCGKCYQLGHDAQDCKEKLALAPGEVTSCAFCDSPTHREDKCNQFWRSYDPWSEETRASGFNFLHHFGPDHRMVKFVPTFCSLCGDEGHYVSECGLGGNRAVATAATWSMTNRDLYVDSECEAEPIVSSFKLPPERAQPGLQMPARPPRARHAPDPVHVEGDDSDGVDFIRDSVRNKAQLRNVTRQLRSISTDELKGNRYQGKRSNNFKTTDMPLAPHVKKSPQYSQHSQHTQSASSKPAPAVPPHLRGKTQPPIPPHLRGKNNPPLPAGPPPSLASHANFLPPPPPVQSFSANNTGWARQSPNLPARPQGPFLANQGGGQYQQPPNPTPPATGRFQLRSGSQQGYHSVPPPSNLQQGQGPRNLAAAGPAQNQPKKKNRKRGQGGQQNNSKGGNNQGGGGNNQRSGRQNHGGMPGNQPGNKGGATASF
jgi:hypothetical protein